MKQYVGIKFVNNGPHSCTTASITYNYYNNTDVTKRRAVIGELCVCETKYGLAVGRVVKLYDFAVNASCQVVAFLTGEFAETDFMEYNLAQHRKNILGEIEGTKNVLILRIKKLTPRELATGSKNSQIVELLNQLNKLGGEF